MLKVLVKEGTARLKSGTSKRSGKPYAMHVQSAWVDLGKPFPSEVQITLADGQPPFPVGEYVITLEAFHTTGFGDLAIDLRKMVPKAAPVAAAKSA